MTISTPPPVRSALRPPASGQPPTGDGRRNDLAQPLALSTRLALASLASCVLLSSLGTSIANVGLPTFARVFHASFAQVQWVVLAYLLAITTLVVGAGRLGDLLGRRRLLLVGIAVFSAASLLCGMAPSLSWLVAARAVQGVGAAIMMALAMAFVGAAVPKARTGAAMGLLGTTSALGTALGPTLGGGLIATLGWPAMFFCCVPLGGLTWWLAYRHLPRERPPSARSRERFDVAGTLLLAVTLGAYAMAMTVGRQGPRLGWVVLAAVGLIVFVVVESRTASPLVRLEMLRDRGLSSGLVGGALVSTVMMATLVVGPFYLSLGLGLNAAAVGVAMSCGPLAAALAGVPAGGLVDRYGALPMMLTGLAAMGVGCLVLVVDMSAAGVIAYLVPLVVVTSGYALVQAANNTAVMADVRAERRGVVSGLLNLSRNLGLVTGASVMGAVFARAVATTDLIAASPADVAAGVRATFAVAAGLVAIGVAAAVAARRLPRTTLR